MFTPNNFRFDVNVHIFGTDWLKSGLDFMVDKLYSFHHSEN